MTTKERYEGVIRWFQENRPVAETELHYHDPFQLLIAVILSAQCTDKRVNMVTPALFEAYPTPQALALATPEEVFPYIKSVSYPNNKSKHLVGMARTLVDEFGRRSPLGGRRAAEAARRRAQDSQRRCLGGLPQRGHGGRHPRLPGLEPHRAHQPLEDSARDREDPGQEHTGPLCCPLPTTGSSCTAGTCAPPASPTAWSAAYDEYCKFYNRSGKKPAGVRIAVKSNIHT